MDGKLLIKNASAVVSCDAEDTVYRDTDILIENGTISRIGKALDETGIEVIDGRGKFVYPGLVNTHHHFFQTYVRNLVTIDYPSMSVLEWIDRIYEIFKLVTEDVIYYSSLTAMADLVKHGCTTAFDHQYCYPDGAGKHLVDRQMDAAEKLGIRYYAGRGANTLYRSEGSTVPDEMVESTDEFISDCERLIDKYKDDSPSPIRGIVVSPCQPINCRKETFEESVALARRRSVMMHTHLGEGENPGMLERYGMRTLNWCREIGFAGPDVWYAHGWELSSTELESMAKEGTGLSHCPAPAVLGGFPILDMPFITELGLRFGLGCDGSATNDSSNLLDTVRMAYLAQAGKSKSRGTAVAPYHVLKAATSGGAAVLGRNDLGVLEPGSSADLFMVDVSGLEFAGALHDPANMLPRVGVTGNVWLTMIAGRVVFKDGELTGVDEHELAAKAEEVCTRDIRKRSEAFKTLSLFSR